MFAFIFHLEAYSVRLILVISCISVGVFLMVFNATTVSIPGIVMIFSASAMAGLRWALTQLAMHKKEMGMTNPFATIYWLAPVMAVTLGMVSLPVEGWIGMFSGSFFEGFKAIQTCGFILLPGGVAFAMVASEY
jgi:solute carrier family 35 protein C2